MTASTRSSGGLSPPDSAQRTARIAGVWFLLTFAFSIPAVLLYDPILNDVKYVVGAGADTRCSSGRSWRS
jgi:hypothetical protein